MKMNPMGRTGVMVSELCLGTMTFGTQTSEAQGHAQLDCALANGINFVDTAEMYPVNPITKETVGRTEEILGAWNAKNKSRRSDYVLATKHSGEGFHYVRNGAAISSNTIPETIEGNLRRLQTDYIDLYQFHWPNRGSYMFRKNWDFNPVSQNKEETLAQIEDCLEALQKQVDKGNIRHFGLSNESAWGTAQWLRLSEERGWPRVATIQNEYSLLCRLYDTDLSELSINEEVGLMAFSPLAVGLLTGKYQNDATALQGHVRRLQQTWEGALPAGFGLRLTRIWRLQLSTGWMLCTCHLPGALPGPLCARLYLGLPTKRSLEHILKTC